jgi:hypothetical protein
MLLHLPEKSVNIPLDEITRNAWDKDSQEQGFIERFNRLSIEEQLKYLGIEAGPLVELSKSIQPGLFSRIGRSVQRSRSCEISSSLYTEYDWDYFRTNGAGLHFEVQRNRGLFRVAGFISTEDNQYAHNHGLRQMIPFDNNKLVEGSVAIPDYNWEGCLSEGKRQQAIHDFNSSPSLQLGISEEHYAKQLAFLKKK